MAFILKNNRKKDKPFVRRVEVGCTGLDLTYGTEAQAIKFVSFAVDALKEYVRVNSAITNPSYSKSMKGNNIRIDYGAKDCYFLIILNETEKEQYEQ